MDDKVRCELPLEVQRLVCHNSDREGLQKLRQVSSLWRHLSLPLLWRRIEISDWEHVSNALDIHATYGRYVKEIEYRRIRRRRGNSHNAPAPASPPAVDGRTKTQVLCEWLERRWVGLRQVTVGAWPPYNVYRVQESIAASCPRLEVLVLEGAAAAWVDTLQRATAAHPRLVGLHITEDTRALLPPAADGPYSRTEARFGFLERSSGAALTHLTVPCLADSVSLLLGSLPRLLPALTSLDLRQLDAGIAGQLRVSLPPRLVELKIHGQHPLSVRMFGSCFGSQLDSSLRHRPGRHHPAGLCLQELAPRLTSLVVTGSRSEEAARIEHEQFWSVLLQSRMSSLTKLVIPVARPELGFMVSQMCPALRYLQFVRAGSAIYPQQNNQWASQLTRLACLRHLDIASSNNEYEGCILPSELVTHVSWSTPWLRTLYMSRISLSAHALDTLLRMLPYLYTLWFTFDATPVDECNKDSHVADSQPATTRLRYLIIHAIFAGPDRAMLDETCSSEEEAPSSSTAALATCLDRLPTLNRCRLPMFTYPDTHRHWLRRRYPHIDFNKYAPPY
ncbi:hypothetical protein GGF44_001436 [Coemansia sp. RSA 1694]|nr:hypothetical protein GGF44_001436 [Coemansia sp. RSA 1694]